MRFTYSKRRRTEKREISWAAYKRQLRIIIENDPSRMSRIYLCIVALIGVFLWGAIVGE